MSTFVHARAYLPSNYKFDWNGPKPSRPLIGVGTCHVAKPEETGWFEQPRVEDLPAGEELKPGAIFLLVLCSGVWWSDWSASTHYGGCSWFVELAFLKEENAKAYAAKHESREQWQYYWVVPSTLLP